jgi:hypothetical protein
MGKGWDHAVPGVEFWAEALRVAKPGAHLVAFGGTRTFHRLAVAIEDAGWEIRDTLSWLYGSGFPKSLDVGKAIDKVNGEADRLHRFTAWMRTTGLTAARINETTGTFMGSHYLTSKSQPAIPTPELWGKLRPLCRDVPAWVDELVERHEAEREVVGVRQVPKGHAFAGATYGNDSSNVQHADTAPATDLARQWHGWGTALKPAWEPIILARKPLTGTVAANVAQHGTGGMNVDGCRIDSGSDYHDLTVTQGINTAQTSYLSRRERRTFVPSSVRWPANVCFDEDAAAVLDEQSGERKSQGGKAFSRDGFAKSDTSHAPIGYGDSGGASRFFYTAKASRREREAGLEDADPMPAGRTIKPRHGDRFVGKGNHHPTVKPIALMRWLCRLVTPPGGLVLDPFTGSGTTGCAAVLEGFRFYGAELDAEYADIARRRIAHWAAHADADAKQPTQLDLAPLADADPPA